MILSQDWDKNWDSFQHDIKQQIRDVVNTEHYSVLAEIIPHYKKGDRFLDAGSGLGRWVFHLEKMGFDSYGLDISDSALRKAREYAKRNNLSSKFIYGDLRNIPIELGFFDLITSFGPLNIFLIQ